MNNHHHAGTVVSITASLSQRRLLLPLLHAENFQILEAVTAAEGLQYGAAHPDLIIVGSDLPDMSPVDLCKQLRADPWLELVPILLVAPFGADDATRAQAHAMGADAFLAHPVDADVFCCLARRLVEGYRAHLSREEAIVAAMLAALPEPALVVARRSGRIQANLAAQALLNDGDGSSEWLRQAASIALDGDGLPDAPLQFADLAARAEPSELSAVPLLIGGAPWGVWMTWHRTDLRSPNWIGHEPAIA